LRGIKAQLHERPDVPAQQAVIDLVEIGEIVDRIAVRIFVVMPFSSSRIAMKATVLNGGGLPHGVQIPAISIAQRQVGRGPTQKLSPRSAERAVAAACAGR